MMPNRIKLALTPSMVQNLLGLDPARYRVFAFERTVDPPVLMVYVESPEFAACPPDFETPIGSLNLDPPANTRP